MMETDEKLKRLKEIRSGNRGVVTKYIKEAIELLNDEDKSMDTTDRLNTIEKLLTEKVELLKELDVKILDLCDVEDIVHGINETEEVYSRVCDVRVKISKFSSESICNLDTGVVSAHSSAGNAMANTINRFVKGRSISPRIRVRRRQKTVVQLMSRIQIKSRMRNRLQRIHQVGKIAQVQPTKP